jgi:hypothetical protein
MYPILLALHNLFRWFVLASLLISIYRAYTGTSRNRIFSPADNAWRHWTATLSHVQLLIGMILYNQSPVVKYAWLPSADFTDNMEAFFFAFAHSSCMLIAIVLLTIGSALAKRKATDQEKFKTMLIWFSLALLIIMLAIPWSFSPFAHRPYIRNF